MKNEKLFHLIVTFTKEQARDFIHEELEVTSEQLRECVETFFIDYAGMRPIVDVMNNWKS